MNLFFFVTLNYSVRNAIGIEDKWNWVIDYLGTKNFGFSSKKRVSFKQYTGIREEAPSIANKAKIFEKLSEPSHKDCMFRLLFSVPLLRKKGYLIVEIMFVISILIPIIYICYSPTIWHLLLACPLENKKNDFWGNMSLTNLFAALKRREAVSWFAYMTAWTHISWSIGIASQPQINQWISCKLKLTSGS